MKKNRFVLLLALTINLSSVLHAQLPQDNLKYSSYDLEGNSVDSGVNEWSSFSQVNEISDLTCVDKNSPADQCFNYFTLSIFWPRGLGYQYLLNNKQIKQKLVDKDTWAIHGLWPNVVDGNVPKKCIDQDRRAKFNPIHFKNRPDYLYNKLTLAWFNIIFYQDKDNSIESFWRHEYDVHGCCAARAESIKDDIGYFKGTLNMYNNIQPSITVKKSGLDIGSTVVLGTFYDALCQNVGSKVTLRYVTNAKNRELILTEIRVCYDLSLGKIDCPGNPEPKLEDRSLSLRLLSRMP